jgi:hypothetical protein
MKFNLITFIAMTSIAVSSCGHCCKSACNEEAKSHKVYSISMNEICKEWDGQWQGISVASDGNCYFGSSTHSKSHGAGFHKFNPETY